MLARGEWNGATLVDRAFVETIETKQTRGAKVNYAGPNDGSLDFLTTAEFPEAPYGLMTWVNTDRDVHPGADPGWAWAWGAGGSTVLWNHRHGIVYASRGTDWRSRVPTLIEAQIAGPSPLVRP
jgi:hypothetical protein